MVAWDMGLKARISPRFAASGEKNNGRFRKSAALFALDIRELGDLGARFPGLPAIIIRAIDWSLLSGTAYSTFLGYPSPP